MFSSIVCCFEGGWLDFGLCVEVKAAILQCERVIPLYYYVSWTNGNSYDFQSDMYEADEVSTA